MVALMIHLLSKQIKQIVDKPCDPKLFIRTNAHAYTPTMIFFFEFSFVWFYIFPRIPITLCFAYIFVCLFVCVICITVTQKQFVCIFFFVNFIKYAFSFLTILDAYFDLKNSQLNIWKKESLISSFWYFRRGINRFGVTEMSTQ